MLFQDNFSKIDKAIKAYDFDRVVKIALGSDPVASMYASASLKVIGSAASDRALTELAMKDNGFQKPVLNYFFARANASGLNTDASKYNDLYDTVCSSSTYNRESVNDFVSLRGRYFSIKSKYPIALMEIDKDKRFEYQFFSQARRLPAALLQQAMEELSVIATSDRTYVTDAQRADRASIELSNESKSKEVQEYRTAAIARMAERNPAKALSVLRDEALKGDGAMYVQGCVEALRLSQTFNGLTWQDNADVGNTIHTMMDLMYDDLPSIIEDYRYDDVESQEPMISGLKNLFGLAKENPFIPAINKHPITISQNAVKGWEQEVKGIKKRKAALESLGSRTHGFHDYI